MSETLLSPEAEAVTAAAPDRQLDDDDRLRPEYVRAVLDAVEAGDAAGARALVEPLHPADIADLFELTPREDRADLAHAVADLLDGDVFAEMNDYVREDLIDALEPHQVADIASELDTDDAVAIIEDMDAADQREVLRAMEPDDRAAIEEALSYAEESAGRLMQRELIAVPEHWSVGDAIDYLRAHEELTTDFWEVFVVDPAHKPVGTVALSWMLRTPRSIPIGDVMKREQTLIPVDMDQEEVALRFQKYALISAAVVDQAGRLVGMITVDDVVHIISEEAGEDTLRLSGRGRRRHQRTDRADGQDAGDLAGHQPGHRDDRGGRGRPVRGRDREIRADARRADGDRVGDGRQCGDADAGGRRPCAGDQPADEFQYGVDDPARMVRIALRQRACCSGCADRRSGRCQLVLSTISG